MDLNKIETVRTINIFDNEIKFGYSEFLQERFISMNNRCWRYIKLSLFSIGQIHKMFNICNHKEQVTDLYNTISGELI